MNHLSYIFQDLTLPTSIIEDVTSKWNQSSLLRSSALHYGHSIDHYDQHILAGRLEWEVLQRTCPRSIGEYIQLFDDRLHAPFKTFLTTHAPSIETLLKESYVYDINNDFFSVSTLKKSYLLRPHPSEQPLETPSMMNIRIAGQLYEDNYDDFLKCYHELSNKYYTHASPTMFNSGLKDHQLSSCFLVHIPDSLKHILYTGVGDCGEISKAKGGLGIDISSLRCSEIAGGGKSSGLFPVLKLYNACIGYVDQGGSRKGAGTIFCTPHHLDVETFITCTDPSKPLTYLPDINICLWMNSMFYKRLEKNQNYTLFCPAKAKLLQEKSGIEFDMAYEETEKRAHELELMLDSEMKILKQIQDKIDADPDDDALRNQFIQQELIVKKLRKQRIDHKVVKASDLYDLIIRTQRKAGMPYMMNSDACNIKSNQKNLGYISQSNLCVSGDTLILTDKGEVQIDSVVDKEVNVWNGTQFSKVTVKQTDSNAPLMKIHFKNGKSISCTLYHKFLLGDLDMNSPDLASLYLNHPRTMAMDVHPFDQIVPFRLPSSDMIHRVEVDTVSRVIHMAPSYCFHEPISNCGIFNGVLLGNCLEIVEKTDADNIPSCNLGALSVKAFVKKHIDLINSDHVTAVREAYDFDLLSDISRSLCRNLNRVIDVNRYPLDEYDEQGKIIKEGKIRKNNMKNRPIGMGVSGLADALYKLDIGFEDPRADVFNNMFFACVYFNALVESIKLSVLEGPYENFKKGSFKYYNHETKQFEVKEGSPFSHGLLQFDLWKEEYHIMKDHGYDVKLRNPADDEPLDPMAWSQKPFVLPNGYVIEPTWDSLKKALVQFGVRNSLLLAQMPTASTAQILCNTESVEAPVAFYYSRNTLSGSFPVINPELCKDFTELGLWDSHMANFIVACDGSIKYVDRMVRDYADEYKVFFSGSQEQITEKWNRLKWLQKKYRTVWEIQQKVFLQLAAKRNRYMDQSQSLNVYLSDATDQQLKALHVYAWKLGLKTGLYYLRQDNASNCGKFTMESSLLQYVEDVKKGNVTPNKWKCVDGMCVRMTPKELSESGAEERICLSCQ